MNRPPARTVQYKGYTITKAILFDGAEYVHMGWDVTRDGRRYQASSSLADAKRVVRSLVEKA